MSDNFLDDVETPNPNPNSLGGEGQNNAVFNLSDVDEDASFSAALLPVGTYPAAVDGVEWGESAKGNWMLTWKYRIENSEVPEANDRLLYDFTVLRSSEGKVDPRGVAKLKKTILRLGVQIDMDTFDAEQFADEGYAIGRPCRLKVGTNRYQGETRNNIKEVLPAGEGQSKGDGFL